MNKDIAVAVQEAIAQREALPPWQVRRSLRARHRLTQRDMAAIIGVTHQAVSKWERGLGSPRGESYGRYLEALKALGATA